MPACGFLMLWNVIWRAFNEAFASTFKVSIVLELSGNDVLWILRESSCERLASLLSPLKSDLFGFQAEFIRFYFRVTLFNCCKGIEERDMPIFC